MAVICYPHLTGPVHYEDGTQLKTLYEDDFGDYGKYKYRTRYMFGFIFVK